MLPQVVIAAVVDARPLDDASNQSRQYRSASVPSCGPEQTYGESTTRSWNSANACAAAELL